MLDWEGEDRFSFEDSERFEEDSLCSWSSEPESLCNNWRGWKRPTLGSLAFGSAKKTTDEGSKVPSLGELTARCVAAHIPFELVEHVFPPVPEQLQLQIAFWSFPDNEEDIRLYSCLANGSAEEFQRGEHLYRNKAVKDPLQIGFHLSASVCPPPNLSQSRGLYNVAVTFDRRRITSCNCTCVSVAYWCSHVVAVCLHRIHLPMQVCLRAPVSESLSRLGRDQLQKFAQYLISELPQQILPTAQRLLDQLLSPQSSAINTVCGAPDPTAGASANEQTSWYLDDKTLHDNIKKILIKFCVPAPIVFSDVNYLSTTAPPAASEWISLLRPLRGREPEGMWNLLSIVREMFKRTDRNAIPLLEIITKECMACEQILVWWVNTKVALLNGGHAGKHGVNSNSHASQHACASLCEEIVVLWRLAALNPGLSPEERLSLRQQFKEWHLKIVEKVTKTRLGAISAGTPGSAANKNAMSLRNDVELFTGFKPAAEASLLDWNDYVIPGVTYSDGVSRLYFCPFTCFTTSGDAKGDGVTQVNSSLAVLNCELTTHHTHHHNPHLHSHHPGGLPKRRLSGMVEFSYQDRRLLTRRDFPALSPAPPRRDGNRSSVSSEGFCENDADTDVALMPTPPARDSDSQEGGGSDSASSSGASTSRVPPLSEKKSAGAGNGGPYPGPKGMSPSGQYPSPSSMPPSGQYPGPSGMSPSGQYPGTSGMASSGQYPGTSGMASSGQYPGTSGMFDIAGCFSPELPTTSKGADKLKNEDGDSDVSCVGTPESRRPSKDGSSSSSDSQQSGDEYNVYFYDPKALLSNTGEQQAKKADSLLDSSGVFAQLSLTDDPWDVLFARAEGLHAHGHGREACLLGVRLAQELLANPPDLTLDLPQQPLKGKKKKLNSASHQLSCLASATLAKCAFLCTLLAESLEHFQLAFRVGLFGLEMARPPASTKPLEVKLANQECELVSLLKRIPLGTWEIAMIRDRANQLKAGTLRSRGEALLPIMLASFIFDALSAPSLSQRNQMSNPGFRLATDEILGFEAAVAALGLKANVSEADHPLLCEGTRRQRGDLAISLLVFYKDDANKVAQIMDKLLDREVHQLIKLPIVGAYYANNPASKNQPANRKKTEANSSTATESMPDKPAAGSGGNGAPSTSGAEFEPHMVSMPMGNPPPAPQVTTTRTTKEARFKNKRIYPSIPNQPSEAGAHFMFELAKTVLTKAGGNSSTSLFTQASTSQNHHGPHRALHICAFQIGLYALGLHNCVSPNWLSRTYSSHVSWITGQAMEIGAPAISFLIDTWEGHLTPPEAVSIADRASRGCDPNIVRAAAKLALSCLPHSHALNPNEIQRAILQCKEQSDLMLEQSCVTVENAAKGGGVYPEVLFQVAKYWYELFARSAPGGMDQLMDNEGCHDDGGPMIALVEGGPVMEMGPPITSGPSSSVVMATTPPPHYQGHPAITTLAMSHVPYTTMPYSLVGLHPHRLIPHPHPPPPNLHMFIAPPAFQYPPHTANQAYAGGVGVGHPGHAGAGMPPMQYLLAPTRVNQGHPGYHMQPPPAMQGQLTVIQGPAQPPPNVVCPPGMQQQMNAAGLQGQPRQQAQVHRQPHQYSQAQWRHLLAAYGVGMLALETLARRVHDDRPQAKYARNPPYGEDVKWLLRVAKKLGTHYLHQFCVCAVNSIVSPFVLHDVALEAAHFLSRNNPALIMQHLRSALTPLVQKCQQMYIQCMHQKLYHLTSGDYEDFVNIVLSARAAFQITPDGNQQFKEWLQSIRRSKSCKKDLWTHINDALQASSQ